MLVIRLVRDLRFRRDCSNSKLTFKTEWNNWMESNCDYKTRTAKPSRVQLTTSDAAIYLRFFHTFVMICYELLWNERSNNVSFIIIKNVLRSVE